MTSNGPAYCRSEAFELFRAQLDSLDRTESLVAAAVAVAMHSMLDASPEKVRSDLDSLAEQVLSQVRQPNPTALLANMHQVLFDQAGFQGDSSTYYDARNSYLPFVLRSRRGIPITLALVYKAVGERVGLSVAGLNCPGHFLVQVATDNDRMIIDPFRRGIVLTREEARQYIGQVIQQPVVDSAQLFAAAGHAQWISRILRNLQNVFSMQQNIRDLRAMGELQQLVSDHAS